MAMTGEIQQDKWRPRIWCGWQLPANTDAPTSGGSSLIFLGAGASGCFRSLPVAACL